MLIVLSLLDTVGHGSGTKTSGPGSMLLSGLLSSWLGIRYRCKAKEVIIAVFFMYTLIESVLDPCLGVSWTKAEMCYRTADQSCDLCCDSAGSSADRVNK